MTGVTREPVRRGPKWAKGVTTQQLQVGRTELALVKEFAQSNHYTIRSVVEAAIVEYLECRGVPIPEPTPPENEAPEPAPRPRLQSVEVTRDDGETWIPMAVKDRWEDGGEVFVMGEDRITYWRNGSGVRSPFRWRWARTVQDGQTKGPFFGNRYTPLTEETDLAPPNQIQSRREDMKLTLRQAAVKIGVHFYVLRGLEQRLTSPLRTEYTCRMPACQERAFPAKGFTCDAHRDDPAAADAPVKTVWSSAAERVAAFFGCAPGELFPMCAPSTRPKP